MQLHARSSRPFNAAKQTARRQVAARVSAAAPVKSEQQFNNPLWSSVNSRAKFFEVLQAEMDSGRCPKQLMLPWQDFYNNYETAILSSKGGNAQTAAEIQATIADCVLLQFRQPYTFPSLHQRMLEPYNYFEFGQRYVGSLTDFEGSVLGQPERWARVAKLIDAGENVVLLANHQTEADPGVFSHMLSAAHPNLANNVIYVAGDRVVTDPFCKPFSMGRNLFCVHSKKHLDDVPELKASKMETNRKTLVAMQRRLNEGGALIWIAPSGGRDRPKGPNDEWIPDKFDPAAVELMRNLVNRAKKPGHLFPMAMYSWPMMPPPKTVDKAIGERRITHWTPVGISLAEEVDPTLVNFHTSAAEAHDDKIKREVELAQAAWQAVCAEYVELEAAIRDPTKRGPGTKYAQPWKK